MSRTFWIRLIFALPAAIAVQVLLRQWVNLSADVGSVGAFVTAIGTLYSVLTGFTVISVWQQFTDTDRAVKREARALSGLYRYVGYVGDAAGLPVPATRWNAIGRSSFRLSGPRLWLANR